MNTKNKNQSAEALNALSAWRSVEPINKGSDPKPNIFWFIIDSLRPDFLPGREESGNPTFIEELAQKGTFFSQCITAVPYTLGSANAVFTGLYPSVNKIDGWFKNTPEDLDKKVVTFADILKHEGYFCASFFPSKIRPHLPPQSFDHYQLIRNPDDADINVYVSAPSPKFAIIDTEEIHDACCANAGSFDKKKYYQAVREADKRVRFFYEKCCGPNDILILSADHGIRLIDEPCSSRHKDELVCGRYLTDKTIKSFLAIVAPGRIPAGVEIKEQVRTIDIAPTVLDAAGLPQLKGQGISLAPYFNGERDLVKEIFSLTGGMETSPWKPDTWSIRTPKWKFVLTKNKRSFFRVAYQKELYDLEEDPAELTNVIQNFPEVANELSQKLNDSLIFNRKTAEDYYKENDFDYKKYLRSRTFSFWLNFKLYFRTLFVFKFFHRPKTQLAVLRIKIRKLLIKNFKKSII